MRKWIGQYGIWTILIFPLTALLSFIIAVARRSAPDHPLVTANQFADSGRNMREGQNPVEQKIRQESEIPASGQILAGHALQNEPVHAIEVLVILIPFLILAAAVIYLTTYHTPVQNPGQVPGGDINVGKARLQSWGCGACHTIPGVAGAVTHVGPKLDDMANRSYIAGYLPNTPDNLVRWIMHPQSISPGNAMPDLGVPINVARDMTAYLYSISK